MIKTKFTVHKSYDRLPDLVVSETLSMCVYFSITNPVVYRRTFNDVSSPFIYTGILNQFS